MVLPSWLARTQDGPIKTLEEGSKLMRKTDQRGRARARLLRLRHRATALATATALVLTQSLGACQPVPASAGELGTMTITNVGPMSSLDGFSDKYTYSHWFEVSGGQTSDGVGFCGSIDMGTPGVGSSFSSGQVSVNPALDWVLCHGWSWDNQSGYGASGSIFRYATQCLIWLAMPDSTENPHYKVWWNINDAPEGVASAVSAMKADMDAYVAAGGGGVEQGCSVFWASPNGAMQNMVTRRVPTGKVAVAKASARPQISDGNEGYTLEGAVYGVYSDETCTNLVTSMTTDAQGKATSEDIRIGTYWVREDKAPAGYAGDATPHKVSVTNGATAEVSVSDLPQMGPVKIVVEKSDDETGGNTGIGAATLEGAQFMLSFTPEGASTPARHWVVSTDADGVASLDEDHLIEGDNFYMASEGTIALPLGTLEIEETAAPKGYLLPSERSWTRKVTAEGSVELVSTVAETDVAEAAIRGDLMFVKADEATQTRMANVAFLLTSKTTGESHVLVSDENGVVDTSTAFNSHTARTNANDTALSEDGSVDDELLDPSAGIWFSGTTETETAPDDKRGALPYDTYELRELACAANDGHDLVTCDLTVSRNAHKIDFGTIDNTAEEVVTPSLGTTLSHDGEKAVPVDEALELSDEVRCLDLEEGTEYRVSGELHLVGTDGSDEGVISTGEATFTADGTDRTENVSFTVDTTKLAGRTLVAFEKLYQGDELVAEHADLTDEGQSVRVETPEVPKTPDTPEEPVTPTSVPRTGDESQTATTMAVVGGGVILALMGLCLVRATDRRARQ